MRILAIDPGPEKSGCCIIQDGVPAWASIIENGQVLEEIKEERLFADVLVMEEMAFMARNVGREVFDSVFWSGRFFEAWPGVDWAMIQRNDVKRAIIGTIIGGDKDVRLALIDRFGGKEKAIGTKKSPGPLHGFHDDMWSALAIGIAYLELNSGKARHDKINSSPN